MFCGHQKVKDLLSTKKKQTEEVNCACFLFRVLC